MTTGDDLSGNVFDARQALASVLWLVAWASLPVISSLKPSQGG
jgi:hypothetical protein